MWYGYVIQLLFVTNIFCCLCRSNCRVQMRHWCSVNGIRNVNVNDSLCVSCWDWYFEWSFYFVVLVIHIFCFNLKMVITKACMSWKTALYMIIFVFFYLLLFFKLCTRNVLETLQSLVKCTVTCQDIFKFVKHSLRKFCYPSMKSSKT